MSNHNPYNLEANFFTLKCRILEKESLQESKTGTMYLVLWLSQDEYFKGEKTEHVFKSVLFNDKAHEVNNEMFVGDWVRISGKLIGKVRAVDGNKYSDLEIRVREIERLGTRKTTDALSATTWANS